MLGSHSTDGCRCSTYTCGCCVHLEEMEIHLNSTSKIIIVKEQLLHFSEILYVVSLLYLYKNSSTCCGYIFEFEVCMFSYA